MAAAGPARTAVLVAAGIRLLLMAALLPGAMTGCRGIRESKQTRWAISIHLKARKGDGEKLLIMPVRDLHDDTIHWLRKIPVASSRFIMVAEPVVKDGKTAAITFTMDPFNRLKWTQIVTEYGGREVAVCVDGYYRFMWRIPYTYDSETHQVTMEGPWDEREAELIAEWAPTNYKNLRNDPVSRRK
jgi:hypothetical protein